MIHLLKGEFPSRRVWLDGEELDLKESQEIWNHSPDGFNWGYEGSGPSQLSLAIVYKLTGGTHNYQEFKRKIIAPLVCGSDFEIMFNDSILT